MKTHYNEIYSLQQTWLFPTRQTNVTENSQGKMAQIGAPLIIPEGFMDVKGK